MERADGGKHALSKLGQKGILHGHADAVHGVPGGVAGTGRAEKSYQISKRGKGGISKDGLGGIHYGQKADIGPAIRVLAVLFGGCGVVGVGGMIAGGTGRADCDIDRYPGRPTAGCYEKVEHGFVEAPGPWVDGEELRYRDLAVDPGPCEGQLSLEGGHDRVVSAEAGRGGAMRYVCPGRGSSIEVSVARAPPCCGVATVVAGRS